MIKYIKHVINSKMKVDNKQINKTQTNEDK